MYSSIVDATQGRYVGVGDTSSVPVSVPVPVLAVYCVLCIPGSPVLRPQTFGSGTEEENLSI